MNKRLTSKEYWDEERNKFKPLKAKKVIFHKELIQYLPYNENFNCVEIGAYPGAMLLYFSKYFGYNPVAIEYSKYTHHIEELFKYNDINNYSIINDDFFNIKLKKYDIVTSFGFIEHFSNYRVVIEKHCGMVRKNGYLVITVPFLKNFQKWFREKTYTEEALKKIKDSHNIEIMDAEVLSNCIKDNNFEILFSGHVAGISCWIDSKSYLVRHSMRWLVKLIRITVKTIFRFLPSHRLWSPLILIIAKKGQ